MNNECVGNGSPLKHAQFKEGQSGNSKGRPKKEPTNSISTVSGEKADGCATGDINGDIATDSGKRISQRKIMANRENSRRSTGPQSAAGKLFSRRNAVRHGAVANPIVVEMAENAEEFNRQYLQLCNELNAKGSVQRRLVLMAATAQWRMDRATRSERATIEKNLYEQLYRQVLDPDNTLAFGSNRRQARVTCSPSLVHG